MTIIMGPEVIRYYPVQRRWRRVKGLLVADVEAQEILVRDFNRYTWGRWRERFTAGMVPHDFESCDWWCEHRGRMPDFWRYVKHGACYWLVNFNLRLAQLVEPERPWRILTGNSDLPNTHSTVWDGSAKLFDMNFLALGVSASEAFALANATMLAPGEYMRTRLAAHWRRE